jgi:hypothetical protein
MSSSCITFGNETATELQVSSCFGVSSRTSLSSVKDLLDQIKFSGLDKKKMSMLGTVATRFSEFANVAVSNLPLEALLDTQPFADWLRQRRYSGRSVRSYCHQVRQLLHHAEKLGWLSADIAISRTWEAVVPVLSRARVPSNLVQFAILRRRTPATFSDADLENWGETMIGRGRKYKTVRRIKSCFRKAIVDGGFGHLFSAVNLHPQPSRYGIRICDMPEPLRSEVQELLRWKQVRFAKGRPQRGRIRAVTARTAESLICRLYGFAMRLVGQGSITRLLELLTRDIIEAFFDWALNERNLRSDSLRGLTILYSAVHYHPKYQIHDWKWFGALFTQLPEDSESERLQRKARKCLPYDVLSAVPDQIKAIRQRSTNVVTRMSWLIHDELLMRFLLTLVWRQRNIRECRVGTAQADNLFYDQLPEMVHVARPAWVDKALLDGSQQCFWQFQFREDETKIGRTVRGVVPRALVPLLEEYLQHHRPKLVGKKETKTLFVNRDGGPLTQHNTTELVAELILKHVGKRVTPHRFRDSFAYAWLDAHPQDYLSLSKILWHQNVQTTLRTYGAQFDESNGICRVDEWLTGCLPTYSAVSSDSH